MTFDPKVREIVQNTTTTKQLTISLEYDSDPAKPYPMILFVPNVRSPFDKLASKPDHFHIPMTDEEAKALCDWLDEYFASKLNDPTRMQE